MRGYHAYNRVWSKLREQRLAKHFAYFGKVKLEMQNNAQYVILQSFNVWYKRYLMGFNTQGVEAKKKRKKKKKILVKPKEKLGPDGKPLRRGFISATSSTYTSAAASAAMKRSPTIKTKTGPIASPSSTKSKN